ncbi:MAG: caspase family protein [Pseudomonadota bacterium]
MGRNYLLTIAIENYRTQDLLSTPVHYARKIAKVLRDQYGFQSENTIALENEKATQHKIINSIKELAGEFGRRKSEELEKHTGLQPEDTLLIYFSGHGRFRKKTGETFILPHEGIEAAPQTEAISYAELLPLLGDIRANNILMISDACFSGGILQGFENNFDPLSLDELGDDYTLSSRQALSSGGLEAVSDNGFRGHSAFCHFLLKVLTQNQKPDLPALLLSKRVENALGFNRSHQPKFGNMKAAGGEGGQFVFRLSESPKVESGTNPFKGLQAFGAFDAKYFGGRSKISDLIFSELQSRNLVGVIGASGSGKSSVAFAGVFPNIQSENPDRQIYHLRPGSDPIQSLFYAVNDGLFGARKIDRPHNYKKFAAAFNADFDALFHFFKGVSEARDGTPVLIVDQWEELFTLCDDESARAAFVGNILNASKKGAIKVLLTVRADFYEQLMQSPGAFFDELKPGLINLKAMNADELREAIEKPAAEVGTVFSDGLIDRLISDVEAETSQLPMLQFALSELWKNRDLKTDVIGFETYEELQGIQGLIERHADRVLVEELNQEEISVARFTLPALLYLGGYGNDVRMPEPLHHFSDTQQMVLRKLSSENCRIVTINRRETDDGATEYVELAHEELIRSWPTLVKWLQENIEFHKQRSQLKFQYQSFLNNNKNDDYLLPKGKSLEDAKYLINNCDNQYLMP